MNHKFQTMRERILNILAPYYVLSRNKLYEIYNLIYKESILLNENNYDTFTYIINYVTDSNSDIFLFYESYYDEWIVTNYRFQNKSMLACSIYKDLGGFPYKIFRKEEYQQIKDMIYHHQFRPYRVIYNLLLSHLDYKREKIEEFDTEIIEPYIFFYNEDKNDIQEIKQRTDDYHFAEEDKEKILNSLELLARLCPSYKLKGYALDEEKIEEMK